MICRHCGAEVPFFAAVCPVCEQRRDRESGLQRAALLVLAGCLLLGIFLFGSKALPKAEPTTEPPVASSAAEIAAVSRTTNTAETTAIPDTTVSAESAAAPREETDVYVTISGTKYHKGNCSYLRSSKFEITLEEAKRQGYTPCSRCFR